MMTLLTLQENAHMTVDTTYKVICCIAIVHAQLLTYTFHDSELSYQFHIILWQSTYFLMYDMLFLSLDYEVATLSKQSGMTEGAKFTDV